MSKQQDFLETLKDPTGFALKQVADTLYSDEEYAHLGIVEVIVYDYAGADRRELRIKTNTIKYDKEMFETLHKLLMGSFRFSHVAHSYSIDEPNWGKIAHASTWTHSYTIAM